MSYIVTHTNGSVYASIGEGAVDNSLGIALIGQNFANYGQLIANNFLQILENQASNTQPTNPIEGQLWWNTDTKVLSVFDGNQFKPSSSNAVSSSTPLQPLVGDQWWDTSDNRLKVYTGAEWAVIGPAYKKNQGFGGFNPTAVSDTSGNGHIILELKVDGELIALVNKDGAFGLAAEVNGITLVGKGITFAPNVTLTGTSLNSLQLGGIAASFYPTKNATSNTFDGNIIVNGSNGVTSTKLTVGTSAIINNASLAGTPVAASPLVSDDSTRVATTAFVKELLGYSGVTGISGYSGLRGISGYSGIGTSGYSGAVGAAGVASAPSAIAVTYVDSGTTTIAYSPDALYYALAEFGVTQWAITGLPAAGTLASWTMEITNGGLFAQTWFINTIWDGGTPPTLSTAGTDVLTFYTYDGGTYVRGFLAASDIF